MSVTPVVFDTDDEDRWLSRTFHLNTAAQQHQHQLHHSHHHTHQQAHVTNEDYYNIAKEQYRLKRYNIAIRCLEIHIRRCAAGSRVATTTAVTSSSRASSSTPIGPLHLLAFSHYHLGNLLRSRECFLGCIRLGFETDWQMLIQIEYEYRQQLEEEQHFEEQEGRQAMETVRKHLQANAIRKEQQQMNKQQQQQQQQQQQAAEEPATAAMAPVDSVSDTLHPSESIPDSYVSRSSPLDARLDSCVVSPAPSTSTRFGIGDNRADEDDRDDDRIDRSGSNDENDEGDDDRSSSSSHPLRFPSSTNVTTPSFDSEQSSALPSPGVGINFQHFEIPPVE